MATSDERGGVMSAIMSEFGVQKFKDEDEADVSPYAYIEKSTVLQECRVFNDAKFVKNHPKRCCQQITKLLYLLSQGETFGGAEASEVFFGVTKLFQSTDGNLRRMVYLFLKEVAESTDAAEVIIVVQSLCKDMNNSHTDVYRANAIRTLAKIIDGSMLGQIDRYVKQAVVDNNELVASSALLCGLQLFHQAPDVVRRWISEVQTALESKTDMVQYHALALLHTIKQSDKLAVSKLVSQLTRSNMRSPLACCLLIRYTANLLTSDPSSSGAAAQYEYLESCLRHKSEIVIYEAARAICRLPDVDSSRLAPAITVLHMFLSSPKPTLRYAAVRSLSRVAMKHPLVVSKCNDDMEALVSDSNRTIATLAITTLLKTGNESGVDRLMKQIASFMGEIGDEFKVVVVRAIHDLCLRYPGKYRVLMIFLSNSLREEGGYDFKKAILDAMFDIIAKVPEATNEGLLMLCEFIEDCEFSSLSVRVLHLLSDKGPLAPQPASFIRFIYNRVILENAVIRASAVTVLAKFGSSVPTLRPSIILLLRRCQDDDDDEVRDRATLHLRNLETLQSAEAASSEASTHAADADAAAAARSLSSGRLPMPVSALTKALHLYQMRPAEGPFSFESLPHVDIGDAKPSPGGGFDYDASLAAASGSSESGAGAGAGAGVGAGSSSKGGAGKGAGAGAGAGSSGAGGAADGSGDSSSSDSAAEKLYKIPEFTSMGAVFRSSRSTMLTESELEYLVSVTKHVFQKHLVFEFNIQNTVAEQRLDEVRVEMECSEPEAFEQVVVLPAASVTVSTAGTCYVAFERNEEAGFPAATFGCELRFKVSDCDPDTGEADGEGFEDEFPVEEIEVSAADFMAKVPISTFRSAWEGMGSDAEVLESFALSFGSVKDAFAAVVDFLGMAPCDNTDAVKDGATRHNAYLSGVFLGGIKVLARMALAMDDESGCVLKIGVRSENADVSRIVADCIH